MNAATKERMADAWRVALVLLILVPLAITLAILDAAETVKSWWLRHG